MSRRRLALILSFLMLFWTLCSACTDCRSSYESAQHMFAQGEYEGALEVFQSLGNYEQAVLYSTYIRTLQLADGGQYALAAEGFRTMKDFLDSSLQAAYYTARQAEAERRYEDADAAYRWIPAYWDSLGRLQNIPTLILQQEYAAGVAAFLALDAGALTARTDEKLVYMADVCARTLAFLSEPRYAALSNADRAACSLLQARIRAEQDARILAKAEEMYRQASAVNPETATTEALTQAQLVCREALALLEPVQSQAPALQQSLTDRLAALTYQIGLNTTVWSGYDHDTYLWIWANGTVRSFPAKDHILMSDTSLIHLAKDGFSIITCDGDEHEFTGYDFRRFDLSQDLYSI